MKKNVSRFIAAFLAAAMSTGSVSQLPVYGLNVSPPSLSAAAAEDASDSFICVETDSGVIITGYAGTAEKLVIPAEINGKPVISIARRAFYSNNTITSASFPDSLTFIGEEAFSGCTSLAEFELPEGIVTLGNSAFRNTAVKEIRIPASLTTASGAFVDCYELKKASFADGTETVPAGIFMYASSLKDVSLPDTVKTIGRDAFTSCSSLTSVTLPEGLESIEHYAFRLAGLTEISLPSALTVCDQAFDGCSSLTKAVLPDGTETIPDGCFSNAYNLEEIVIPDTVTAVGKNAFSNCRGIKQFDFYEGITAIGEGAFSGTSLSEVNLPSTLKECSAPFAGCSELKKVTFADGTETVPDSCMYNASALEEAVLPDSVRVTGKSAFSGCRSLKRINLPEGLETIGEGAFGSTGLTEIVFPSTLRDADSLFGTDSALNKAVFADGTETVPAGCLKDAAGLSKVILPDTLKAIGGSAFSNTASLKSITLPAGLGTIGESAFDGSGLTDITIPDSVTELGDNAFRSCERLKTASAGTGITAVGEGVFSGDIRLESVTLSGSITSFSDEAFSSCEKLAEIDSPVEAGSFTTADTSFADCWSLKDSRFIPFDWSETEFSADKTDIAEGDKVTFTVSFKADGEAASGAAEKILTFDIPEQLTVDEDSFEILFGEAGESSGNEIHFTSDSGKVRFTATAGSSGDFAVTSGIRLSDSKDTDAKAPVGKLELSVRKLTLGAPAVTGSLSAVITGSGPKGTKIDICMNGETVGSAVTSKETGSYAFTLELPESTNEGEAFTLCAKSGEAVSAESVMRYSKTMPVISSIKLSVNDAEDTDITEAFTGNRSPLIYCPSRSNLRFTLSITNYEALSRVFAAASVNGTLKLIEASYDEREGVWIASGSFGTGYSDIPSDVNFIIINKADIEDGYAIDLSHAFYSTPGGLVFRSSPSGTVYDGSISNPVAGAELSLIGRDRNGKEYTCDLSEYGQDEHTLTNEKGQYLWSVPDGEWKIVCSAEGFDSVETGWLLIPEDSADRDFDLAVPVTTEPPVTTATGSVSTRKPVTATTVTASAAVPTTDKSGTGTSTPTTSKTTASTAKPTTTTTKPTTTTTAKPTTTTTAKPTTTTTKPTTTTTAKPTTTTTKPTTTTTAKPTTTTTKPTTTTTAKPTTTTTKPTTTTTAKPTTTTTKPTTTTTAKPTTTTTKPTTTTTAKPTTTTTKPTTTTTAKPTTTTTKPTTTTTAKPTTTTTKPTTTTTAKPTTTTTKPTTTTTAKPTTTTTKPTTTTTAKPTTTTTKPTTTTTAKPTTTTTKPTTTTTAKPTTTTAKPTTTTTTSTTATTTTTTATTTTTTATTSETTSTTTASASATTDTTTVTSTTAEVTTDTTVVTSTEVPATETVPVTTADVNTAKAADGGFSAEQIAASPVKPVLTLPQIVLPSSYAGKEYTFDLCLDGCDGEYSSFAFHLRYSSALEIVQNGNSGILSIAKGIALADNAVLNFGETNGEDYGWKGVYLYHTGSENNGGNGSIARITVKIPDYASSGDIYPLDIVFRSNDNIRKTGAAAEANQLMQAYLFTQGIYNKEYNNTFTAAPENIAMISKLAQFSGAYDGYIAISDDVHDVDAMLGDVNGDTIVDANDASEILGLYAQISTGDSISDETKAAGDVNCDGLLDSTDASLILEYYALASTGEKIKAEDFFRDKQTA